jgi:hypothetical protein
MSYELKQTTILECEVELLRSKITNLNQEIRMLKAELRLFGIVKEMDDKIHNAIVNGGNGNGLADRIELNEKTELCKWAYIHKDKLPKNVFNVLINPKTFDTNTYVEDITWEQFNKYRGLGAKAWELFNNLRNNNERNK